jgi:hypothetical protein
MPSNYNSFFKTLSVAIAGDESREEELYVRTLIELSVGKRIYQAEYKLSIASQLITVKIENPEFDKLVSYIQAAATVLQKNIMSVYPSVNDNADKFVKALNRKFTPRDKFPANQRPTVYIMWTSTSQPKDKSSWTANHIVPLLADSLRVKAAKTLDELKENTIKESHDSDSLIQTLNPSTDGYQKLKYFQGNVRHSNISCLIYNSCMHVIASKDVSRHYLRFFQRWGKTCKRAHGPTLMYESISTAVVPPET